MSENVLLWALKLILGALILMPFVGGIGCAWINHWFNAKAEYEATRAMAQAEALKSMVEKTKKEG